MKLAYESPEMEVIKFSLNTYVLALTASTSGTEGEVGDGDENDGDWNPFG